MQIRDVVKTLLLCSCSVLLLSCNGNGESEIAKAITMRVTSRAIVVPSTIDDFYTCLEGDVSGPRTRMRASISWSSTMAAKYGNLVPLVFTMEVNNPRVQPNETSITLSASDGVESVAFLFGIDPTSTGDFIPPDDQIYSSGDDVNCFLDYGGLPKPINELKGSAQLIVPVTMRLSGITRTTNNVETPFVKEIKTNLVYSAGSIPED